jgi:hypothetical protein
LDWEVLFKEELRVKENIERGSGVVDVLCGGQQE